MRLLTALIIPTIPLHGQEPAGHWAFDGNLASQRLEESYGRETLNATAEIVPSIWASRINFGQTLANESSPQYLSLPNLDELAPGASDFSISVWLKRTSNSGSTAGIIDALGCIGNGFQLFFQADNSIRVRLDDTDNQTVIADTSGPQFALNTWRHCYLAIDRQNDRAHILLDGIEATTAGGIDISSLTGSLTPNQNWWIGTLNSSTPSHGEIDDLAIFQRLLTPEEISDLASGKTILSLFPPAPEIPRVEIDPPSGLLPAGNLGTLTGEPDLEIRYTTDGTEPTKSSTATPSSPANSPKKPILEPTNSISDKAHPVPKKANSQRRKPQRPQAPQRRLPFSKTGRLASLRNSRQPSPMTRLAALLCCIPSLALAETRIPSDEHFRVDTIATGFVDTMEMAVTPTGEILIIERTGALKIVDPKTGDVSTIDTIPVEVRKDEFARECGLLGITLDPKFSENQWLYLYYSIKDDPKHRLARFQLKEGKLSSQKTLLDVPHDRENATCHEGGSLAFGPDGCLYLSTGDNTCPFQSDGSAPIDERPDRKWYDAQRSAANTNDLRGKILRIKPTPEGGYTIPDGNLFPVGTAKTRPEIYVMGCRNPYRISIDSETNFLYWGKVGPDAGGDSKRGPRGYDEINQARKAGNFGWPYFIADNKPYADYDFATKKTGPKFDPTKPVNHSPNNTGLTELPPAQPAFWHYPRASACAGPVFYSKNFPQSGPGLPKEFDSCLIAYDWTSTWIRVIKLDEKGDIVWNEPWLSKFRFVHPGDMAMGPQGELYILEYGTAWYDGNDGALKRVTYSTEPKAIEVPDSDPRMVGLPKDHPGSKLIASTTCLACHTTTQKSIGPTYKEVAKKYAKDPEAVSRLAEKILNGGTGVWGQQPMPPHPQHNIEETQQMVEAILKVGAK